jgi:molybdopterin/thiamine biosynthesis adenylyltransferase
MTPALTDAQIERYSRQLILPEIGLRGQQRLLQASVGLLVASSTDASVLLYLASAGVGRIGIFENGDDAGDADRWQPSRHLGRPTEITMMRLGRSTDATEMLRPYQVVIDVSRDERCRQRSNAACMHLGIPLVLGGARRSGGLLTVLAGHRDGVPCYDCVAPSLAGRSSVDALSSLADGLMATLHANEALKVLLEIGAPLYRRLLRYDLRASTFSVTPLEKRTDCQRCRHWGVAS